MQTRRNGVDSRHGRLPYQVCTWPSRSLAGCGGPRRARNSEASRKALIQRKVDVKPGKAKSPGGRGLDRRLAPRDDQTMEGIA